jgi:hypothetical protein
MSFFQHFFQHNFFMQKMVGSVGKMSYKLVVLLMGKTFFRNELVRNLMLITDEWVFNDYIFI